MYFICPPKTSDILEFSRVYRGGGHQPLPPPLRSAPVSLALVVDSTYWIVASLIVGRTRLQEIGPDGS